MVWDGGDVCDDFIGGACDDGGFGVVGVGGFGFGGGEHNWEVVLFAGVEGQNWFTRNVGKFTMPLLLGFGSWHYFFQWGLGSKKQEKLPQQALPLNFSHFFVLRFLASFLGSFAAERQARHFMGP